LNNNINCEFESKYVLITPARNEEKYIERTILSVISQKILPTQWVVVSDGSTDRTDEIVNGYLDKYSFIRFKRLDSGDKRDFSSKAYAIDAGYQIIKDQEFDYIGNLDADISFDINYYKNILHAFNGDNSLGIAGGMITELVDGRYEKQRADLNSVAGPIQLFRRKCYENIGGYIPLKTGGIDAAAEIIARMNGWKVRTFPEFVVRHNRRMLTSGTNVYNSKIKQGMRDFYIGYHPAFQFARCLYRLREKPFFIGSVLTMIGYLWLAIKREKKLLPDNVIKYLRREQIDRLRNALHFNNK